MINNFDNIEITEDDIKYAEKILFGKSGVFDIEERRPIIENFNESFDVNACPGSGKSTVLIAKLIILSRKMPLKSGQGVCVLTHTNVAINEIKDKLGEKSDILFKYPNYIGTIQSFIDKYLAIPYFKRQAKEHVKSIDDDIYRNHILKLSKNYYPNIKRTIEYCIEKQIGNYIEFNETENFINFILGKHFKFINNNIYICNWSGATLETKKYYKELFEIMFDKSFKKGILRYEDAYILADRYISQFVSLSKYFSNRFKYVFIDEMQDTNKIQEDILEKIFDKQETIVQRFGDINQNIGLSNDEESGWVLSDKVMSINSSKRYGEEMVKYLQPLRIFKNGNMTGNGDVKTLSPHIIIFNDSSIDKVINKFIKIIQYYKINEMKGKIKVVGKIGIDVESPNLSIKSYTNEYVKSDKKDSFNKKVLWRLRECKDLKNFYENLISIIILSLNCNGKKISKEEFKMYMEIEKNDEFINYKANIKKWFYDMGIKQNEVLKNIVNVTSSLLSSLEKYTFEKSVLEKNILINIVEDIAIEEVASTKCSDSIYIINDINTVFGVKGETHLATLYLESKYIRENGQNLRSDIMKILDYMLGKKQQVDDKDKEAAIAAYVAMSRAEKLTCIAISYNTIQGRISEFREYGYKIIPCDNEIKELIDKEF